jgi:predicted transcriptional regulator
MKSVLISIQPKWCELIASGKKTVEVRKTKPKLETPFKVYIYATEPRRKKDLALCLDDGKVGLIYRWNYDYARRHKMPILSGKVIGEFVCDKIYQYSTSQNCNGVDITDEEMTKASCLTKKEIEDYEFSAEAKDFCIYKIGVYGWHITDLVIYDEPKELSEFYNPDKILKSQCMTCIFNDGHGRFKGCKGDNCWENTRLKRPPQSWCYVGSEDTE